MKTARKGAKKVHRKKETLQSLRQGRAQLLRENVNLQKRIAEQQKKIERLEEVNIVDPLTGLLNRRGIERFSTTVTRLHRREGDVTVSILFFDLDHFHDFNERKGHLAGDELLKLVASKLKKSCRAEDLKIRYGGDEFCIIMSQTSLAVAKGRAEYFISLLEKDDDFARSNVKVSIGLTCQSFKPGDTIDALVREADAAMYRAKKNRDEHTISVHEDAQSKPLNGGSV